MVRNFNKVMVANRGEIAIRVFRACTELKKQTVAVYAEADQLSLHRQKADEAYEVGHGKGPVEAYLDIEDLIRIAKKASVDAIHPGYGFLAENVQFAQRVIEEGFAFIGPSPEHLRLFGDKLAARHLAEKVGLPVKPGTPEPVQSEADARLIAKTIGYPVIIKAIAGGGGRGMRVVHNEEDLSLAFNLARSEAQASFGDPSVYLEKAIERPKHIEVQILADHYGNMVHLFERDCSVQRRHQKVVEFAPSLILDDKLREDIYQAALAIMRAASYVNAGTVEFLMDQNRNFYFLEVNPRIQVEHTVTELITGIDLVQAQIRIAEGYRLDSPEIGIPGQEAIERRGYAIQCRVTTEDPLNNFLPDTGKVNVYRSASGFGIRLDAGNGFTGTVITPYYDSLLVKVSSWALRFEQAASKMLRSLQEMRVRGVKTNIPFLENVIQHPLFLEGKADTSFVDTTPELYLFPEKLDRGSKLLKYIGHVTINGYPGLEKSSPRPELPRAPVPMFKVMPHEGTRTILEKEGPKGLINWIGEQKKLLVTDTTFRDAHQSLLATRVRTFDMLNIARATGQLAPDLFSMEMWGGATFDVAYRFLKESPWQRLVKLRKKIPHILFQMLIRGANAVGYTNYPDNVVRRFIQEAAEAGIDIFRVFDSLNWIEGMRVSMEAILETGKVLEAAICYTGDILDPDRDKYNLKYYIEMAKQLEKAGSHILCIKDMAGLLKPYAAEKLIKALKEEVGIPVHLHTHDTSGNGMATVLKASEAGVDIVDLAISSMSGLNSQPSLNALVAALQHTPRDTGLDLNNLQKLADYWEVVRQYYAPYESGLLAPSAEVYQHEMPGGQYSNLRQQAEALGLGDRWQEVKTAYRLVNQMLGDIVKVTPSSKMVGDFALFMVKNNLSEEDLYSKGPSLTFPESVVQYFEGYMGQPPGGFPEKLQQIVLKERRPIRVRPGELLEPVNWDKLQKTVQERWSGTLNDREITTYALYPSILEDYLKHEGEFGDVSVLDTLTFFYGLKTGQQIVVEIEDGKTLIIKLTAIGELEADGTQTLYFELNGQMREIKIKNEGATVTLQKRPKAMPYDPTHVGASMPGKVVEISVKVGEEVNQGQVLAVTEAMKMKNTLQAHVNGRVKEIFVKPGDMVEVGDLIMIIED